MSEKKEDGAVMIPYFVHEGAMARLERINKRWFILFIIILALLFATNAGWIIYESQFEDISIEQEVDTGDAPAVVSGMGDATYGQSKTDREGQGEENQR